MILLENLMSFVYLDEHRQERLIQRNSLLCLLLSGETYYIQGFSSQEALANAKPKDKILYWVLNPEHFVDNMIENNLARKKLFTDNLRNKVLITDGMSLKDVLANLCVNPDMTLAKQLGAKVTPPQSPIAPPRPAVVENKTANTGSFFSSERMSPRKNCYFVNDLPIIDAGCVAILEKRRNMTRYGVILKTEETDKTKNYFFTLSEEQTGAQAGKPLSAWEYIALFEFSNLTAPLLQKYFPGEPKFSGEHFHTLERLSKKQGFKIDTALAEISQAELEQETGTTFTVGH